MNEINISLQNYRKAVNRLHSGIEEAQNELDQDGVLQRFEFTFELFWKTLKLTLNYEGIECYSPRSCIKEAYRQKLLTDGETYLDMLEDRNLLSHAYDKDKSRSIYERIKENYSPKLQEALNILADYTRQL